MEVSTIEQLPEEGSFFAKVDQVHSMQDYAPYGPCLRLIGITEQSYGHDRFNDEDGCWTFLIDVGWNDLGYGENAWQWFIKLNLFGQIPFGWDTDPPWRWVKVNYRVSRQPTDSYAYALFTDQDPQYLDILGFTLVEGGRVDPLVASEPIVRESSAGAATTLTAFHVGQGMCSLMTDGRAGYLLDAGAGTPVRRDDYRRARIVNDLRSMVEPIERISAIVSHPDTDHWRLLDWDPWLLDKVDAIYLPDGVSELAFKSPAVKRKVIGMHDAQFTVGMDGALGIYRSAPSASDRNGECLVASARIGQSGGLLAGDYVYSRMLSDTRPDAAIRNLATAVFHAVVVPHHGDLASSRCYVRPEHPDVSIAFFSAGTHSGYHHPTNDSLDNHQRQGFSIVDRHWLRDIRARQLLTSPSTMFAR